MKRKTKERLLQNWEQILEGDYRERTKWDIKLNISAPQILFVESFCDKSATVVLIDFGKLNVRNLHDEINIVVSPPRQASDDDEECFHTPCSSPQNECKSPSFIPMTRQDLSEASFRQKMYNRFSIELGDMQILVGRTRDNLKHAHHKGTSTLHVLDRFNISILLERRALYSNDPNLPSLKFSGSLPKLVVHINEQKVAAIRSMIHHMQGEGLPSPFRTQDLSPVHQADVESVQGEARTINENASLLVLRFCIDDMSLEVQSRGRPVAELQVSCFLLLLLLLFSFS
jgi:vacuolar protein sorting-associated protein 13D